MEVVFLMLSKNVSFINSNIFRVTSYKEVAVECNAFYRRPEVAGPEKVEFRLRIL